MSLVISVLKRPNSNDQLELEPPCKKIKVDASDAKSQLVAQQKLPLTPVNTPPTSPQKLCSPMKYHNYTDVTQTKPRQLRNWPHKASHTLAPFPIMESDFRLIQRNYPQIRSQQRMLGAEVKAKLQFEEAEVEVTEKKISVSRDGKTNSFGVHEVEAKKGKVKRAYPISGEGVITLTGAKTFELIKSYNSSSPSVDFQQYVAMNVENIPPANL